MTNTIPISCADWFPIYAKYPHDNSIEFPERFFRWFDGYPGFEQDIFKSGVDTTINRDTILYLPNVFKLSDFITEKTSKKNSIGSYITMGIYTGSFFNNKYMYVSRTPENRLALKEEKDRTTLFRFIINDNNTFSLMSESNLYVTVEDEMPFNLYLTDKKLNNDKKKQQFAWKEKNNKIYFIARTGDNGYERYWSFSRVGDERGYMRACGMSPTNTFRNDGDLYDNRYLFDVVGYADDYNEAGNNYEHSWVKYYNEFHNTKQNKTVDNETVISEIPINHLIDTPYNTKIDLDNKTMQVNVMNLKNTSSRKYEDAFKNLFHYDVTSLLSAVSSLYDDGPPIII